MVYGYIMVSTDRQSVDNERSKGFTLGRPHVKKFDQLKLSEHEAEIQSLLDKNISKSAFASRFGVCRNTVVSFLKNVKNPLFNPLHCGLIKIEYVNSLLYKKNGGLIV